MSDLKYNFLGDNFTIFENVENPKVELKMPLYNDPFDISDWSIGLAENGTPIVKDNLETNNNSSKFEVYNTEEYTPSETLETPTQDPVQVNLNVDNKKYAIGKQVTGNKQKAMNFFISKGLSTHAAAGIVGNLMLESGDPTLTKTNNIGDKGTSYGIAQWRLERRKALNNFAKQRRKPISDFNTQLEFLWEELNSQDPNCKKALQGLLKSKNAKEAAIVFMNNFERPSSDPNINGIAKRIKYAESLLS